MAVMRLGVVGCGLITGKYIRSWLEAHSNLEIPVIADVSTEARAWLANEIAEIRGLRPLEVECVSDMVAVGVPIDAVYVATPHASHLDDASTVLNSGLDLLIEKPLARNRTEAEQLCAIQEQSGRQAVVAYQGSLSPTMAQAKRIVVDKQLGELKAIHGAIWQNWRTRFAGNWRQQPETSGGGFLIDTGAHLLNTLCHVMGKTPMRVCAVSDMPRGMPEFITGFLGVYSSGVPVAVISCGDSYQTCEGWLEFIFSSGRMRVECWGRWLEIQTSTDAPVERWESDSIRGPMEAFLAVWEGRIDNPSSVSRSLEVAALHEAIVASGQDGGTWRDVWTPIKPGTVGAVA